MKKSSIKLRADQVDLHYRYQESGRINLLFVHGWNIDSTYWEEQIEYFSEVYSVYAIDLPGFGDSTAERIDYTFEEYALDIRDFIKHKDLKNIVLIGHSMAGAICIEVALQSSDEIIGVIGVDNLKTVSEDIPFEFRQQITAFMTKLNEDFSKTAEAYVDQRLVHPNTPEEVKERIRKDFRNSDKEAGLSAYKNLIKYSERLATKLQMLPQKLYLINSDFIETDEVALEKYCKNGYELRTIKDTGHYPMIERADEFNQILNSILIRISTEVENELIAKASVSIKAPLSTVWRAITDSEIIGRFMTGLKVDTDWEEGSDIEWSGISRARYYDDKGVILKVVPMQLLRHSYYSTHNELPDEEENYNIVTYQLGEETDQTLLLITQDNNPDEKARDNAKSHWETYLKELKSYLESPDRVSMF